jgi:hypothetical protein
LLNNSQANPLVLDPAPTPTPATLIQVGKLIKIDNVHLKTFPTPMPAAPFDTFDTRPITTSVSQIGDTAPPNPSLTFHYPLFTPDAQSQYKFLKVVQFSPRGEGVIDNSNYSLASVSEIGLEPTHGATVPASIPANVVAIQFTGVGGNVRIYRR